MAGRSFMLGALAAGVALSSCGQPTEKGGAGAQTVQAPSPSDTALLPGASPGSAQGPAPVSGDDRAAAMHAIGLKPGAGGQVENACGEAITPDIYAVDLGGEVGRALLVVMKGGPTTAGCYGMTGMEFHLLKQKGRVLTTILSDVGHVAPMETTHNGVKDIAVGGPGFEFPVYEWNGTSYEATRTIPDSEFPPSVN